MFAAQSALGRAAVERIQSRILQSVLTEIHELEMWQAWPHLQFVYLKRLSNSPMLRLWRCLPHQSELPVVKCLAFAEPESELECKSEENERCRVC